MSPFAPAALAAAAPAPGAVVAISEHRTLDVPDPNPGAMRLEPETSDEVRGASAIFENRRNAIGNGRTDRSTAVPGPYYDQHSVLALIGRDLLPWVSIALSLLVSVVVLAQRSRSSATRRDGN